MVKKIISFVLSFFLFIAFFLILFTEILPFNHLVTRFLFNLLES